MLVVSMSMCTKVKCQRSTVSAGGYIQKIRHCTPGTTPGPGTGYSGAENWGFDRLVRLFYLRLVGSRVEKLTLH